MKTYLNKWRFTFYCTYLYLITELQISLRDSAQDLWIQYSGSPDHCGKVGEEILLSSTDLKDCVIDINRFSSIPHYVSLLSAEVSEDSGISLTSSVNKRNFLTTGDISSIGPCAFMVYVNSRWRLFHPNKENEKGTERVALFWSLL